MPLSTWLRSVGTWAKEVVGTEAPGAIIGDRLQSWVFGTHKAPEPTKPRVDVRMQLYADIAKIEAEGDELTNLWLRLNAAAKQHRENRMVTLLAKLPPEYEVRKQILLALDGMPEEKFDRALKLLEHDAVWQFLLLIWDHAGPALNTAITWLGVIADRLGDAAMKEIREVRGSHRAHTRAWMRAHTHILQSQTTALRGMRRSQISWWQRDWVAVVGVLTALGIICLLIRLINN